ncbi:hypothetical protein Ccrd_024642 [Cynara cardunculus var. scolymus]|uniref:Uncharacterized protein n=1 Tax=Cynara cardunculus var. scolymus TaxID=59895 RepID=A0A103XC34_CYNCS|nr:hypothetical protein Ccrd_024642 [Cynara cardunculus var. scolymus]
MFLIWISIQIQIHNKNMLISLNTSFISSLQHLPKVSTKSFHRSPLRINPHHYQVSKTNQQ